MFLCVFNHFGSRHMHSPFPRATVILLPGLLGLLSLIGLACSSSNDKPGAGDDALGVIDWNNGDTGPVDSFELPDLGDKDTDGNDTLDSSGDQAQLEIPDLGGVETDGLACGSEQGCNEENARRCVGDDPATQYEVCKITSSDCLEWKGPLSCGFQKTCVDGECRCEFEACGISCCEAGQTCTSGYCCTPVCETAGGVVKECGPDGCGGECGTCEGGTPCDNGSCACTPDCNGKTCGGDGCGGSCGDCPADYSCWEDGQCHLGGCVPQCAGKVCGPDGCEGFCGLCTGCDGLPLPPTSCLDGQCPQDCCPECTDAFGQALECGADGCGGLCGFCAANETCDDGTCVCIPACEGKSCGDDGCGGLCGTCYGCGGLPLPDSVCSDGVCPPVCCAQCDDGQSCGPDGCGGVCGVCLDCAGEPLSDEVCEDGACPQLCCAECIGRECGPDGCGSFCGPLPEGACPAATDACTNGQCVCQPQCTTDNDAAKECGPDGCGAFCGVNPLGQCSLPQQTCIAGLCDCSPQCTGKECGDDGCGGECGPCPNEADICTSGTCVCQPSCIGKECGSDGCAASCGECPSALYACEANSCVHLCGNETCDEVESCEICPGDCGVCSYVPDEVALISRTGLSGGELVMIQTLQGILAQKKPTLYLVDDDAAGDGIHSAWITDLVLHHGVNPSLQDNPWVHVANAVDALDGYILFDLGQDSENVATSLAGILHAIAVTPDMEADAQAKGLALVLDARGKDESWAWTNYAGQFASDLAVELSEATHGFLRDLAVMRGAFVFSEGDAPLRSTVAEALDTGATVLGGGAPGDQATWFATITDKGALPVPASQAGNLSLFAKVVEPLLVQQNHIEGSPVSEDGVHYVALVMGGGHRIDWLINDFLRQNWWGNPNRGAFTMNWELHPLLGDWAPAVLGYLFDKARVGGTEDYFVAAPSGHGYATIGDLPNPTTYAQSLAPSIVKSDLRVLSVVVNGGSMAQAEPFLEQAEIHGLLFRDANTPDLDAGAVQWHVGKPAISYRYHLTDDGDPTHTAAAISEALNALPRTPKDDPNAYSLVYVDPEAYWGGTDDDAACMNTVAILAGGLDDGVRMVTVETLLYHMRKNFGLPMVIPDDAVLVYEDLPKQLQAGEEREVHVTIRNTGSNVWKNETGYTLSALGDSDPFAAGQVLLPEDLTVGAGYEHSFSFTLTAPETPGTYIANWRMERAGVGFFGEELYAAIGVGGPPTWTYEAESDLWSSVGKIEGDGVTGDPLYYDEGFLISGPDETHIPGGSHQAIFSIMAKSLSGPFEAIAELSVYDADTDTVLGDKTLYRSNFTFANAYQDVVVPFTSTTGHRLQLRVLFKDKEWIKVDKVTVK